MVHCLPQVNGDGENEWECIESMVDSGAARSVCPVQMCEHEGVMTPHNGPAYFRTATGARVKNIGLRSLTGVTDNGTELSLAYNVAEVSSPLDSVSQICDKGNIVIFTQAGGFICGPHGKLAFKRKNDTYVRNTWIRKNPRDKPLSNAMEVGALQGFPRQGPA